MKEKIINIFKKYKINLSEIQINQFYDFFKLIIECNKNVNLTAITDEDEVVLKHFLDSCLPASKFVKDAKLIDVGAGAGFPSIPLKILRPDLHIVMIDSLQKRVNFLNTVIKELNLENITALHERAEDLAENFIYREKFDYAVARAVASLPTLSEYLLPFVKIDGFVFAYKAIGAEDEAKSSLNAIHILGGDLEEIDNYRINEISATRKVVVIKKTKSTPIKYPRKKNLPKTNPL